MHNFFLPRVKLFWIVTVSWKLDNNGVEKCTSSPATTLTALDVFFWISCLLWNFQTLSCSINECAKSQKKWNPICWDFYRQFPIGSSALQQLRRGAHFLDVCSKFCTSLFRKHDKWIQNNSCCLKGILAKFDGNPGLVSKTSVLQLWVCVAHYKRKVGGVIE